MVFITAEIGINHNGDVEIAKKLIDVAKQCGCDAVKFQKRTVEKVYSKEVLDTPRESPWGTTTKEQKLGLEFNKTEYDIIDSYCKERKIDWYASAWDKDSQLFHMFRIFPVFIYYMFMSIIGKAVFIHFKALNKWPLKFFAICFPYKTIFSESSAVGYAPMEKRVSEMIKKRKYVDNFPMGNNILSFSKSWEVLEDPRTKNRNTIFVHTPFNRKFWVDYVISNQEKYFNKIFNKSNIEPSDHIISYMLCWMGPNNQTRMPNLYPELFDETLSILEQTCPNQDSFNILLKIIKKHPKLKVIIMHLHPMVLACRTKFFIANTYTTTFAVAKFNNIPCIEYTDYKETILKETNNGSIRPDIVTYFINRDAKKLKSVIKTIMQRPNIKIKAGNIKPIPSNFLKIFRKPNFNL